jgi:hypothetical protein
MQPSRNPRGIDPAERADLLGLAVALLILPKPSGFGGTTCPRYPKQLKDVGFVGHQAATIERRALTNAMCGARPRVGSPVCDIAVSRPLSETPPTIPQHLSATNHQFEFSGCGEFYFGSAVTGRIRSRSAAWKASRALTRIGARRASRSRSPVGGQRGKTAEVHHARRS